MVDGPGCQVHLARHRPGVRVASGKFWSDITDHWLCAFGGRGLIAATTVRTVLPVRGGGGRGGGADVLRGAAGPAGSFPDIAGMLPFAPIASLLIELDARTGFTDCFTHAGGRKQARSADLTRNVLAVLIGMATNLGLTRMAEACGIPYDVLRWTQEWYVRE